MSITDQIEGLHSSDEANYCAISAAFREERALINELASVYDSCVEALRPALKDDAHFVAFNFICGLGRKHLLLGAMSLFRAHSMQMFRETRAAMEAAGMAFCAMKHKDMLKILLDDVGTPETREAVMKTFTQKRIFRKEKRVFRRLDNDYDYCSWRTHTNMAGFASHLTKEGGNRFNITTQDIQTEQAGTSIPLFLISLCLSHFHILTSVDETFDHLPVTDALEAFMVARETFEAKLMQIILKHRGTSIAAHMEDEQWLNAALDPDR
jgi:hypothetical protein